MKKWIKIVLLIVTVFLITGSIMVYRIYTKPHRDVSVEKGVALTAQSLYDAFKTNEAVANTKYLDKTIELTGVVAEVTTNQAGNTVVNFTTTDPQFMINCTFKVNPGKLTPGETITFKGICTGYIPDFNVVMNEGVLVEGSK